MSITGTNNQGTKRKDPPSQFASAQNVSPQINDTVQKKKPDGIAILLQADKKIAQQEYMSQYYQDNKEKISEHYKQYYQDNKEKISEHYKQYYQDNKEKIYQRRKDIRAKKQSENHRMAQYQALATSALAKYQALQENNTNTQNI